MWHAQREEYPRSEFRTLLRQAHAGDNSARAQLYSQYGLRFRKLIAGRLRKTQLTWATTPHDVLHTVVLRVWQETTLAKLEDEIEFIKYVTRAVDHEIRDLRRRLTAGRRDYRRQEPLREANVNLLVTPADQVGQVGDRDELAWIRGQLSPADRQILDLWLAGMGWTTMAAQLGRTAGAIRKRFRRSLTTLRQQASVVEGDEGL